MAIQVRNGRTREFWHMRCQAGTFDAGEVAREEIMTAALDRVRKAIEPYPDLEIILFGASTHTSELAAQAVGVEVAQIAKTLMFLADGKPVLVVACGGRKIDARKLGKALGDRKIRFADADSVLQATGFEPGGVCPFGIDPAVEVCIDRGLYDYDVVYAAAGTANSALPVAPERLREIIGARIVDVAI
jgi:Cys-tRNA(Pro) deacylase